VGYFRIANDTANATALHLRIGRLTGKVPHVAVPVGALSEHFVLTTIGNPKFSQESSSKKCVHSLSMFSYNEHG